MKNNVISFGKASKAKEEQPTLRGLTRAPGAYVLDTTNGITIFLEKLSEVLDLEEESLQEAAIESLTLMGDMARKVLSPLTNRVFEWETGLVFNNKDKSFSLLLSKTTTHLTDKQDGTLYEIWITVNRAAHGQTLMWSPIAYARNQALIGETKGVRLFPTNAIDSNALSTIRAMDELELICTGIIDMAVAGDIVTINHSDKNFPLLVETCFPVSGGVEMVVGVTSDKFFVAGKT